MMEGFPFSSTNHQVLSHLDELFPLLYVNSEKINAIETKFTKLKPKDAYWEFWCVPEQMLPDILEVSSRMVNFLQRVYRIRDEEEKIWKVNALDIMTTLALFMQGTWRERLAYLFRWYNFSQTNLLEEEEHFLLIRGVARCLRKLRLIGLLDVTDDDAHQMALEARIIYDEENIPHMRPGLVLDHLVDWLMHSKFCKVLLDFYSILQRLVDMMKTLDARSFSLLNIMEQKIQEKRVDLPTTLFRNVKALKQKTKVFVTHVSSDGASFLFPSSDLLNKSSTSITGLTQFPHTLYALVERRIYVESEHYKIEAPIVARKQVLDGLRHAHHIHCCNKYFVESNMRILHRNFSAMFSSSDTLNNSRPPDASYSAYLQNKGSDVNQGIQRYELDGILPDAEYDITLFSSEQQWGKIELKTSPPHSNITIDASMTGEELHFCILPSTVQRSLSLRKHLDDLLGPDFCNMEGRSTVIMTGSLLSSADVFQKYLFPLLETHRVCPRELQISDISLMLRYISSSLAQQWKTSGFDSIASIFEIMQIPMANLGDVPLLHLSGKRQLISFNGDGPLASSHYCLHPGKRALKRGFWRRWLHQLASQVHPKLASFVIDEVESLYNRRIASQVSPVSGVISPLPNVTLCMIAHSQAIYYDPVTHCSLTKCAQMIQEKHVYDALSQNKSKEAVHRYVILIRDPSDLLMDSEAISQQNNDSTQDLYESKVSKDASLDEAGLKSSTEPIRQSRLFGKYELVHGEYNEPVNSIETEAPDNANEVKNDEHSSASQQKSFQRATKHIHAPDSLTEFLQIALEYQRSHPQRPLETDNTVLGSAAVTIVCCNWVGGKNMKIVYRPPPKGDYLSQQNFSAPGYDTAEEKKTENSGDEEVVVLKILNLSACESYTEPADLFYKNHFALFANHPLLQRATLEANNEKGTQSIDWYVRLIDAWENRMPPHCSLEFDDDTDTRVFHLHNRSLSSLGKLDEDSLSVSVMHDDGSSMTMERPMTVNDYLLSCPLCWKEDELEADEEDSDTLAKFWQESFGWDSSWVIDNDELFAWAAEGTSEAVETPATSSLPASQQGSFVSRATAASGKESLSKSKRVPTTDSDNNSVGSRRKGDPKKRKSSAEKVVIPLTELYARWDIPSFLLSHGYTTLPRRANKAIFNHAKHLNLSRGSTHQCIPFQQTTLYRPVFPSVPVGIEVRRFHAYEVDETSISVTVQAIGWGRLQCGIVALPSNVKYQDALHLLHIAPKTMMQRTHKKKLQSRWIHHLASVENSTPIPFRFDSLKPGTKYAVFLWYATLHTVNITAHQVGIPGETKNNKSSVPPTHDLRSIRDVVLLATLPPRKVQPLPKISCMFAPFTAKDFGESFFVDYEGPRIRMLRNLVNQFRFSYSAVQAVSVSPEEPAVPNDHISFSRQYLGAQLLEPTWREFGINNKFTKVPLSSREQTSTSFVSNKASTQSSGAQHLPVPGRSIGNGLFVQYYGPFCVLKMKNDTVACLEEATKFLESQELNHEQNTPATNPLLGYPEETIRVLIVITSRTFVSCFRVKTTDYAGRGMHSQQAEHGYVEEQEKTAIFVRTLCDWQSDRSGRDVRLLTGGHVPDMLCIHIYRSNVMPIQRLPETVSEGENDGSIDGSMKKEAHPTHAFLSQRNTAEYPSKVDPCAIIMYVFPTNLPPVPDDEEDEHDLMDEDDNVSVTSSVVADDASPSRVSETPAATTITPGLESSAQPSEMQGKNVDNVVDSSTVAPLSIITDNIPGGTSVGTEITPPPPSELVSPSKSLASKKTFVSMSVLTTTSSYIGGPTTSVNSTSVSRTSSSLKRVSVDGVQSLPSGSISTKPFPKSTAESSRKEKRNESLPHWIFPSFGQPHVLSDDICFSIEIFSEAKSAKHFKPSNYQHQQRQLLRQLHETQPQAAISSGDSIVSMSTTSLSLAGAGSAALLSTASQFENYCSYHPAQHAWYMSRNDNINGDFNARVMQETSGLFTKPSASQRVPYEPLPVFHMLDFVLPVLPDPPARPTRNEDRPANTYRTYPLTLRGTKKDAIFIGSGGAGSTYLHHNSRVFNYPPKTRYLPPPKGNADTFVAASKTGTTSKCIPQSSTTSGNPIPSDPNSDTIDLPPRCWMFAHQVATSLDLLRIVLGPLVGQVTKDSVRILFEFNMNISLPAAYQKKTEGNSSDANNHEIISRSVRCRLRYTIPTVKPSNDDADSAELKKTLRKLTAADSHVGQGHVDVWLSNVVAFQPSVFVFRDLYPNVRYEILLPDLYPNRVLGTVQTLPLQCSSVELIFTADNCVVQVPAVEDLLNELSEIDPEAALPDIHHILDRNKYLYNFRSEDVMEFATFQQPFVYLPADTKVIPGVTVPTDVNVSPPQASMWHFLTEAVEAAATGNGIKSVFHLAPLSPIAELENNLWSRFSTHLYARSDAVLQSMVTRGSESLELLQQFQLEALEHLVRDSFRVILSTPAVAAAFATCGHMLLHHPKYLLPVQNHTKEDVERDPPAQEKDSVSVQDRDRIIRRMFDHQVQLYVHSLFDGNMEQADINKGVAGKATKDVFRDWRQSGVVVAMVDIISYRLKTRVKPTVTDRRSSNASKKEDESKMDTSVLREGEEDVLEIKQVKDGDAEEDEGRSVYSRASRVSGGGRGGGEEDDGTSMGSNNPRSGFSLGFLDRKQWQRLRIYAGDNTILHLIMVFPQPLISLQAVRDTADAVKESDACLLHPNDNDEMIPWLPTNEDLTKFFSFWFDWMGKVKQESQGNETKSILIVSSAKVPYSTLIQDMRTGFKIYQLCVGEYDLHTLSPGLTEVEKIVLAAEKLGIQQQEIVMSGKIGTGFRYVHQFQGQDCYRTEPSGLISVATSSSGKLAQASKEVPEDVKEEKKEEFKTDAKLTDDNKVSKKKEKKSSKKKKKTKDKTEESGTEYETGDEQTQPKSTLPATQLVPYQRGGTGNVGFAKMKLYLDHWSPIALWSNTNLTDLYNKAHNIGEATLLMGPLIGAPIVKRSVKRTMKSSRSKRRFPDSNDEEAMHTNTVDGNDDEDYGESVRVIDESRKHPPLSTSTLPLSLEEDIFVPMMLEVDRIANIRIDVRGTFTHHHLILEHTVPAAERPFILEIGPLHRHDRYRIRFTSGIKLVSLALNTSGTGGHPKEFVLNTHYHRDESNFILLNLASPGDTVSPAAVHLSDLRRRSNVAFHGVHNLVLTHFEPEVTDTLRTLQQSPLLKQGMEEFQEILDRFDDDHQEVPKPPPAVSVPPQGYGPIIPTLFRKELSRVLSTLRERYRENFCGPSLKDLLRMNMNLLLPKLRYDMEHMHHVHHQGSGVTGSAYSVARNMTTGSNANNNQGKTIMVNGETLEASMERLLHLLDAFVAQEYIDHFRFYDVNVYRVLLPTTAAAGDNRNQRQQPRANLYGMWQEDGVDVEREDVFAEYVSRDLELWHDQRVNLNDGEAAKGANVRYKLLWMHDRIGHASVPRTSLSPPSAPPSAPPLTSPTTAATSQQQQQEEQEEEEGEQQESVSRPTSPGVIKESHHSNASPTRHQHTSKGVRIRHLDASRDTLSATPDGVLEALVVAWLAGCVPAPTVCVPYHSLNRKASIERLRNLDTPVKVQLATRSFIRDTSVHHQDHTTHQKENDDDHDDDVDHHHSETDDMSFATPSVRLLVLADDDTLGTQTTLMSLDPSPAISDTVTPLLQRMQEWQDTCASHRRFHLFLPCIGQGTVQRNASFSYLPDQQAPPAPGIMKLKRPQLVSIVLLDSVFRSNEYDRRHQIAELEKTMFKKQLTAAAAKSKRAQQKKEEEERQQRQLIRQQVLDIVAQQRPDGYVFVHCHTAVMYSPIEEEEKEEEVKQQAPFAANAAESETVASLPLVSTTATFAKTSHAENNADEKGSDNTNNNINNNNNNNNNNKTAENKPRGMVIIDTMGGTASTAAPVPANTNVSPSKTDRLMLLDNHDTKPSDTTPSSETHDTENKKKTKKQKPQQRDELTILEIELCGDLLPLQLAYETQLETRLQAAKTQLDPLTGEPYPLPPDLQFPKSGKEHIAEVLHHRRYNFLQYPPWFVAYFPAHVTQATFVVDEVLLLLRQSPRTQALLRVVETDASLYQKFVHRYETSRLSELSRPEDLREVDMSTPEVVAVFFYDVVRSIWQEDIPKEMKGVMLSLQDPFVVGYIASRAFQFPAASASASAVSSIQPSSSSSSVVIAEALQSSGGFAQAMRRVCLYAMAMKMARDMSGLRRYRYLLEQAVDPAWEKIQTLEITERMIDNATRRRHAERNAEKQFMTLIRKMNESLLSTKKNAAKASASSNKVAKFAGKSTSSTSTSTKTATTSTPVAAVSNDDAIDAKNMDVVALAEKLQEEDAEDALLAAQIAEITQLRAETVDYESDIEELIKEAERHERGSDQESGDNDDNDNDEDTGNEDTAAGHRTKKTQKIPSKLPSNAQKAAAADVDAMIAEEEAAAVASRQKQKMKRPLTPNRRLKPAGAADEDSSDDVVYIDETGQLDETALAQLQLQRGQWEQEAMDETIDRILESLVVEGIESFQESYMQELILANLLPVTSEERSAWAAVRMKRLAEEHRGFRRIYGQRANPLGI